MAMKPIPTRYKGYHFRSRLEARWAVFFDALGIRWEYELEGFELDDGTRYLPDFYLPELHYYIEIKPLPNNFDGQPWPEEGSKEEKFILHLCQHPDDLSGNYYILFGSPGWAVPYDPASQYAGCTVGDSPYFFCECEHCSVVGIAFDGRSARLDHKPDCCVPKTMSDKNYNINSDRILAAADAAKSARFEFGESGATL